MNYQLIPYERTAEMCEDLFQHRLSLGTLNRFGQEGFKKLRKTELKIKAALIQEAILHVDESGIECNGKNEWLHVASTEKLTHFASHPKRGLQAIEEIGIIPEFRGVLVHDHFQPYFCYTKARHELCNAHHLRELAFIQESENEEWAGAMKCFLLNSHEAVENASGSLVSSLKGLSVSMIKYYKMDSSITGKKLNRHLTKKVLSQDPKIEK